MAAIRKIDKDSILDAAYNLVRKEGLGSLSARKLAKASSCSTQPIYENFNDMGVIIELTNKRVQEYMDSLKKSLKGHEYADYIKKGIAVYEFANDERMLFRHFVMGDSADRELFTNEQSVKMLMETEGYDEDKAKIIDKKVNDHILGNAFLLNSDYIQFDENYLKEELEEYLQFVKANIAK